MGWFSPKMIIIYIKCIFHIDGYRWFSPYVLDMVFPEEKEKGNYTKEKKGTERKMSKCKSCGANIIWIPTINGKAMPCDAKPIPYTEDPTGRLTLVTSDGRIVRAKADATSDLFGYVSHFATCPNANAHRKAR